MEPHGQARGTPQSPFGANIPYQRTNSPTVNPWSSWCWDRANFLFRRGYDQTKDGERMRTPLLDWFTGLEGDLKFPEMGT